jgi:hypothetical protein
MESEVTKRSAMYSVLAELLARREGPDTPHPKKQTARSVDVVVHGKSKLGPIWGDGKG